MEYILRCSCCVRRKQTWTNFDDDFEASNTVKKVILDKV